MGKTKGSQKNSLKTKIIQPPQKIHQNELVQMKTCPCDGGCPRCGIQTKLEISRPGDIYEQEADKIAEQIVNMPVPITSNSTSNQINRKCNKCKEEEEMKIHRKAGNDLQVSDDVAKDINSIRSGGAPLDSSSKEFMESRFGFDFSKVRIHTDNRATRTAESVNALAYTVGNDIVFGKGQYKPHTVEGRRILAHELTHVVQQNGITYKQKQRYETSTFESLTNQRTIRYNFQPAANPFIRINIKGKQFVARQNQITEQSPTSSYVESIIEALNTQDPIAGIGDYTRAYELLNGLSMNDMIDTLVELSDRHYLEILLSREPSGRNVDPQRIMTAVHIVSFSRTDAVNISQRDIDTFVNDARYLPLDQQLDMLRFISQARGISSTTREGITALLGSELTTQTSNISPAVSNTLTGGVEPGPWQPPGNQPIPFYIGNEAHVGIAAAYVSSHPGDITFTNYSQMSTLLQELRTLGHNPNLTALNSVQMGLKPDITNLTRLHLYEIKPLTARQQASTEAKMYVSLFVSAGIPITLGPVSEPGTAGAIPAPNGVYTYEATGPGVITYEYFRKRIIPVPFPVPEREPVRRWRFEFRPLTPQQQVAVATVTVGGVLLIIAIIALAPVGA